MSNRSVLLNTTILSSDRGELDAALQREGKEFVEIAEGANRIPIPWMCCFRSADLRPVQVSYVSGDARKAMLLELLVPCAKVSDALATLERSRPIFQEIAGDATLGGDYWQLAVSGLQQLPLPYLTLDPREVVFLNDPTSEAAAFARCFSGNSAAIPFLKQMSFYQDGHAPYTVHEWYSLPPTELDHTARRDNSAALAPGYAQPEYRYWHRRASATAPVAKPSARRAWWQFWKDT